VEDGSWAAEFAEIEVCFVDADMMTVYVANSGSEDGEEKGGK